jgi:hypothetical protein
MPSRCLSHGYFHMANVCAKIHPEVLPDAHTTTSDLIADTGMATTYWNLGTADIGQTVRSNEQMMQSMKGATSRFMCYKSCQTYSNTLQHCLGA